MNFIFRSIFFITLIFTLPLSTFAQSGKESQEALGKLFDQYATVAGGWYMNNRCNILDKDASAEFEWYVGQVNIAMGKLTKNANMLLVIQQSAKKAAESEKYKDCGKKGAEVVEETFKMAKNLNQLLTNTPYEKGASGVYSITERYASVAVGMQFINKCKFLPADFEADVKRVYDKVTDELLKTHSKEVSLSQKKAQEKAKKIDCKVAKTLVKGFLVELRKLEALLEVEDKKLSDANNSSNILTQESQKLLNKYVNVNIGMKLNNECNYLSDTLKRDAQKKYNRIEKRLTKKFPDAIIIAKTKAQEGFTKKREIGCVVAQQIIVISIFDELKELEKMLD